MKKYNIAVLDDYQNVTLESADWSVLRDRANIVVFQNHLADSGFAGDPPASFLQADFWGVSEISFVRLQTCGAA